ncbi:unnamed protein product [Adineta steineri]|uniref:Heme haloperoxidase family profile domain-containing protein n=1 Tax=Adineta steineri TaxID=433720 RepID=A0A814UH09_9BILA|nr:unnamed protein product [Adineta steineri]CAF1174762.1 unnamed protein product [Adineta steineri]
MMYYKSSAIIFFIWIILVEQCISFPHLASKLGLKCNQPSDHPFIPPGPNDIRGPCPGLNTAANHGYINRTGITNFDELVTMQQDLYNFASDTAIVLTTLGVALDGDPITGKLSIGRQSSDVSSNSTTPPGLNGHNRFEGDASLTRNDFYLANGNNFLFNGTLFKMMYDRARENNDLFDWEAMAQFRYDRYQQSKAEDGQFVFAPPALLLYGAASFVYEVFPNGTDMVPRLNVISPFFGAQKTDCGEWRGVPERIPCNWVKRKTPYSLVNVSEQMLKLFLANPVLFGGNNGTRNSFTAYPQQLETNNQTVSGTACFIYQGILSATSLEVDAGVTEAVPVLNYLIKKLDPIFGDQFGCPSTKFNLT